MADRPVKPNGAGSSACGGSRGRLDLEDLYNRQARTLLNVAYRMVWNQSDAEEMVQEAFLRLHNRLTRQDVENPEGFLRRVVVNLAIDHLRRIRPGISLDAPLDEAGHSPGEGAGATGTTYERMADVRAESPGSLADRGQRLAFIQAAMETLPLHERAAFTLREFEELSYQEIAECLGATMAQVKTWLHRARQCLARELKPLKEGGLS